MDSFSIHLFLVISNLFYCYLYPKPFPLKNPFHHPTDDAITHVGEHLKAGGLISGWNRRFFHDEEANFLFAFSINRKTTYYHLYYFKDHTITGKTSKSDDIVFTCSPHISLIEIGAPILNRHRPIKVTK